VLPPKPHTLGSGNTAGGVPLSYSAQVAEQFSSSYRQTPSQERGRLDAARLAQFNQPSGGNTTAGASLMTTTTSTAGAVDGQARPVRPSEMKDEGYVLSLIRAVSVVVVDVVVRGVGWCAAQSPPYAHPLWILIALVVSNIYREQCSAVSSLLSSSVSRVRVSSTCACYVPLPRFCGERRWHRAASRVPSRRFLFPYLATQAVETYFCSPLCRFAMPYAYAYAALHPLCRLPPPSSGYTIATCLQQDVCRRLILGYNRWYFFFLISFHSLAPCNVKVHFANLLNVRRRVIFYIRGLAKLLFRVRKSRCLHDRPGRRWQVARVCIPHV